MLEAEIIKEDLILLDTFLSCLCLEESITDKTYLHMHDKIIHILRSDTLKDGLRKED